MVIYNSLFKQKAQILKSAGFPGKTELSSWIMLLREVTYMGPMEIIYVHKALHETFGDSPSEAIIEGEQSLSKEMKMFNLEHRYQDNLSELAGTKIENPEPPTLEELNYYLEAMTVQSGAISLVQGVENTEQVYAKIDNSILPESMNKTMMSMLNKFMPPGIVIGNMPAGATEDFAKQLLAYDLHMEPTGPRIMIVPFSQILKEAPKAIAKSLKANNGKAVDLHPRIVSFEEKKLIHKFAGSETEEMERFVLAAVLTPEIEDAQKDIYSKVEVRKACHWWAEFSGQFSHRHVLQGGVSCKAGDIIPLENYIMPVTCTIGKEEIPQGSWMLGSGIRDENIWNKILTGELNAYSIGARAMVTEEVVSN